MAVEPSGDILARLERLTDTVMRHDRFFRGDGEQPGVFSRLDMIDDALERIQHAVEGFSSRERTMLVRIVFVLLGALGTLLLFQLGAPALLG